MDTRKLIGQKIKEARDAAGWNQNELAKRFGVSDAHISRIENGQVGLEYDDILKFERILGRSKEWLLPDSAPPERTAESILPELQQAIKRFEVRMIPILGHAQFSTTMDIYSHVIPSMQQKAAQSFDAAFESLYNTDDTETKKEC